MRKHLAHASIWSASLFLLVAAVGCSSSVDNPRESTDQSAAAATTTAAPIAETVRLNASQDTTVKLTSPNKNYGTATVLDINRTLVQFSSAEITAALGANDKIVSARLEVTLTKNALRILPRQVGAFRLTRSWSELGATWFCPSDANTSNSRPDCSDPWSMGILPPNPWASPASSVITVPAQQTGVVQFDVTPDVLRFVGGQATNNGWMLLGSTPGEFAQFASRESGTPPQLVLQIRRCSPALCDDHNGCTVESCDANALCVSTTLADGTACSDSNACTHVDACQSGTCVGTNPVSCSASDACHAAGACDTSTGSCSNPPLPVGTACADNKTCDATGLCKGTAKVVINEVESNGGTPGDWVELYNTSNVAIDLSGYRFLDNDNTHTAYIVPAATVIAGNSFLVLEEAQFVFGLGGADSARLYDATGALIDTYSWTAHATTTYGRCPDGTGAFHTTTTVTKGAPNDCSVAIKINEIESSGGTPGDWVELYNAGPSTVDLSGWILKDNDDTHIFAVPAGTSLAPATYLVLDEATFVFGLGGADSVRLFDSTGLLVDSYSWTAHATTTYGRCPNGTGALTTTNSSTKGTANACPGEPAPPAPWPAPETAVTTVDGLNVFGGNLSGLTYQPASIEGTTVLWAVRNGPSTLYRLVWDGTIWTPEPGAWSAGITLRYTDGTGAPDSEGVTKADLSQPFVYVSTERNNDNSGVSKLSILRFDTSLANGELIATHDWDLTSDLPAVGANLGLEGITWIADTALTGKSFFDESKGHAYNPAEYPDHGTGLFFVGIEASGMIYAYALDHVTGGFTRIASIASGQISVMDLSFDRDVGVLWSYCDDTCNNRAAILGIDTNTSSPTFGHFKVLGIFDRPAAMPNINNEGIAFAPEAECSGSRKAFFWTDDSQTDGHSIRTGVIPCGPLF